MLEGLEELDRKLKAISEISIEPGIKKGISFVQREAKENCPDSTGELKSEIFTKVRKEGELTVGVCYTNVLYGPYVELGTGPKGQANHVGISPNVDACYKQSPWWIHESQIDGGREVAEKYHWFHIDTPNGRFYQCTGQAAQPFLYPALKNNENRVADMIKKELQQEMRRILK